MAGSEGLEPPPETNVADPGARQLCTLLAVSRNTPSSQADDGAQLNPPTKTISLQMPIQAPRAPAQARPYPRRGSKGLTTSPPTAKSPAPRPTSSASRMRSPTRSRSSRTMTP